MSDGAGTARWYHWVLGALAVLGIVYSLRQLTQTPEQLVAEARARGVIR